MHYGTSLSVLFAATWGLKVKVRLDPKSTPAAASTVYYENGAKFSVQLRGPLPDSGTGEDSAAVRSSNYVFIG